MARKALQKRTQVNKALRLQRAWHFLLHVGARINLILKNEFYPNPKKAKKTIVAASRVIPFISIAFILIGIALVLFPSVYAQIRNPMQKPSAKIEHISITTENPENNEPIKIDDTLFKKTQTKEPALRIVIPNNNIDLPITESKVVNGYWEVSETTASHGMGSANPGEIGNTVIFAHAREGLFLPLRQAKKGEYIYVLTHSSWHRYEIEEIKEVLPSQIEVIKSSSDERLTLFTCSGFLDEKRLIIVAKPLRP